MGKFASGKRAIAISDRSGMQFPYTEMVKEWNGMWVHYSEFEIKQPQLDLAVIGPDGIALEHPRPPQRTTPKVAVMLPENPFTTYAAASSIIFVWSPNHGRNSSTTVRFRGTPQVSSITNKFSNCRNFDGISGANLCKAAGYSITVGQYTTVTTTLNGALDSTQTTGITLTDGSSFKTTGDLQPQVALIDSELIRYTTITENVLGQVSPTATSINPHVVERGAYGTTKAAHLTGATVRNLIDPTDWFYFTVDTDTATVGNKRGGGFPVSAGPVTLTP
jgi:hypothetical protein